MTLAELQEKRGRLVTQAREALETIKANTDESRATELNQRHDTIMGEFDAIEAQIAREERTAAAELRAQTLNESRRPLSEGEQRGNGEDQAQEYRLAFAKYLCGTAMALSQEERATLQAGYIKTEKGEFRAQTGGSGAAGGFMVPTELYDKIILSMRAHGPMWDPETATEILTTSGVSMKLPGIDDTGQAAAAHTEGAALRDDGSGDVTIGQRSLDAYSFDTPFLRWSWELNTDALPDMETLLADLIGQRLGRTANAQLTVGTGTSAPNGIVTASGLGVTTASGTGVASDEFIDLVHSVDPAYRVGPKVGFQFNDTTLRTIRKLKDGQGNYLWQMGDVQKNIPGTFLGYKYLINQAIASIPTTAAASRIAIFGDFSKYFVRKVGTPLIGVLHERFWPDNAIAGLARFDGEIADPAAIKHMITRAT